MTDPFDLLRDELVRAAALSEAPLPRARHSWLRSRPRLLVLVAALVVLSGSAAAAVISLSAHPSQPLAGRVPLAQGRPDSGMLPVSLDGHQYQITVTPDMTAGYAGWCTGITYSLHGKTGGEGGGACGGGYPTSGSPLFGPDVGGFDLSAPAPQTGDIVDYLLTGPRVEYVRVGRATVAVRHDPDLPAGDGVVVFFVSASSPPVTVPLAGQRPPYYLELYVPPHSSRDRMPPWLPRKSGLQRVPTLAAIPLDRDGSVIPNTAVASYGLASTFWQARTAARPGTQQPTYNGPSHPLSGACELGEHGLRALTPEFGHVVHSIKPVAGVQGAAFLSCIDTEYYLHGWPLTAAVLLNAAHPGRPVSSIPDTERVAADPGMVTGLRSPITALRVGDAWLIVRGGRDQAQRVQALHALRITRVRLPRPVRR
jgi:hypothetical protein